MPGRKRKKNKIALQKVLGTAEPENPKLPDECKFCSFKYSHKYSIQDHIFTKGHIANVRMHLESANKDGSGSDGEFTIPPIPGASGVVSADSTTNPTGQTHNNNSHLQLLQMASMQMAASVKGEKENQDAIFQQLYSLGNNSSYPPQNQFLHNSMFSANVQDPSQCDFGSLLASIVSKEELEDYF